MKDYQLNQSSNPAQSTPVFVQRAMTWAKATNEITGVIRGLLADGSIVAAEAVYLRDWIKARPELLQDALVGSLAKRIERIFADGVVTAEELVELKQVLVEFAPDEGSPTLLPLNQPEPDVICTASFCFTGTFISGTREWCEAQIENRGGTIRNLPGKLPDYLVIGAKASAGWRNQSYGKKIEAAVAARDLGRPIKIICEDHWLKFLN